MKSIPLLFLILTVPLVGCSKDRSAQNQGSQSAALEPDNTGRNVRDRNEATKTPGDQSENEADRTITQNIRKAITADDSLSTNAKNVKIITNDGTVTLRGTRQKREGESRYRSESETGRRCKKRG